VEPDLGSSARGQQPAAGSRQPAAGRGLQQRVQPDVAALTPRSGGVPHDRRAAGDSAEQICQTLPTPSLDAGGQVGIADRLGGDREGLHRLR
jgi:hypothetical protein